LLVIIPLIAAVRCRALIAQQVRREGEPPSVPPHLAETCCA